MKHKTKKNCCLIETGGISNPIGFGTDGRKIKKKTFNRICERANALVAVIFENEHAVSEGASAFLDKYCHAWPRDQQRMVIQVAHHRLLDQATRMLKSLARGEIDVEMCEAFAEVDKANGTPSTADEMRQLTLEIAESYANVAEALNKFNVRLGLTVINGPAPLRV